MIAYIVWNPSRVAFEIPYLHLPVYWYSIFFALGLMGGYLITVLSLTIGQKNEHERQSIRKWAETLFIWVFVGILIGARLGHVMFYDLDYYLDYPLDIAMTWKGGLASHGGIVGLLIACWLYWKRHSPPRTISWREFLDAIAIGSTWTAACIRLGNFFNQEIVGTPTSLPWGIVFGSPADLGAHTGVRCHPVQLYEAITALALFVLLTGLKKWWKSIPKGAITGIYLIILFSFRIFFEALKLPQSIFDCDSIYMGQALSIPFIFLGIYFIATSQKNNAAPKKQP